MMLTHRYDFKSLAEIYESDVINNRQLIKGVIHFSREAHENLKPTKLSGPQYPTRAIQFGEGNFLRAFIDWQLDLLNEKTDLATGVTIVRPINTVFPPSLNTQDGLYTTVIRGLNERGEAVSEARIIRSVNNEDQSTAGFCWLRRWLVTRRLHLCFQTPPKRGLAITPGTGLTICRRSASRRS